MQGGFLLTSALAFALMTGASLGPVPLVFWDSIQLAAHSQVVLQGRVVAQHSRWSLDGTQILTDVDVDVGSVWRGRVADRVRITQRGGELDGVAQSTPALAYFASDEEVVVFLSHPSPLSEEWWLTGMAQGKYRVDGAQAVPETLRGVQLFDERTHRPLNPAHTAVSLEALRVQVDAAQVGDVRPRHVR